jgi:hypothetical protein
MSKRELIAHELNRLSEAEVDRLLAFLRTLADSRVDESGYLLVTESSLGKDWLSPEEDAAWESL